MANKYHLKQAYQINNVAYPSGIYEEGALPKEVLDSGSVYAITDIQAEEVVEKTKKSKDATDVVSTVAPTNKSIKEVKE